MLAADQPNHSAIPPHTPAIFRSVDFVNCISSSDTARGCASEVKPNKDPEDQRVHNNTQKGQIVHQATAMLRSTADAAAEFCDLRDPHITGNSKAIKALLAVVGRNSAFLWLALESCEECPVWGAKDSEGRWNRLRRPLGL